MIWLLIRNPAGTALVEHHALVPADAAVISRHDSYPEASKALADYRAALTAEALREAGQGELFG